MMQTKLLVLKNLFERPTFEPDSLPAQELDFLINLGPKKVDEQYVVSNNSYEILCLLMRIDIKSKGAFPKLQNYLMDVAKGIFGIKAVSQYYFAKTTQRLELLEFDIINKVNTYLVEVLTASKHKSPITATIKNIVLETYIPKFQRLVSELSNQSNPIEQNFDKNEILWLRSLLKLPMRNPLLKMFATDEVVRTIKEELRKMMNVSVNQQTHDGFYKTGVLLHLFGTLDADLNTLQFASSYTNMLIKRYLKFEEINQKLLNPFRLALETCVSFQERFDGYTMESSKTLSLQKLLGGFLTELNGVSESFYVKFINDILKSIEVVFWRIPTIQEKVKVIDILFNYYMRCKSFSENVQQMMGDNRIVTVGNTGGAAGNGYTGSNAPIGGGITINLNAINLNINDGKYQLPEKKKEETLQRLRIISELVLNYIFRILEQEDFDSTLVDYNNSLVYNFIVHVFNILSTGGMNDLVRQNGEAGVQSIKDPRKFEIYGFKFLYHLVKRFQSTRMNELIYNLISSRYSLKVSLNELKHVVNSIEEKKSQKLLIKMKLQMSLNIADSKLFQKSMNELATYYSEVIEDPKFRAQEEFTYSLFKKIIKKAQNEEKLLIVWNQITGSMTRLAKEVILLSKSENLLQYFAKNLECVRDMLWKIVIKKNSPLPRDPKFIEKLIEVWIQIMLQKQYILKVSEPMVQEIALLTPRLIQVSAASYSNTFLINTFLNNQKIIDKYRRNMKHVLREKMTELRPKIRNLTLGEMMFLLSIDYILDVKISEITQNYRRILEVKKDIPFIETIFCYVRDVLITEKENLKEVLEELLVRKARSYLTQIMLVNQQRLQMHLVEKDFVTLLQSSCSINRIYMKISQMFIKEFIREFPKLIFQELVISSLCETLEFFYRKVQYQYDSVSSRLKLSHYNLRLAVPNTLKELHEVLAFLLACVHSMCLRGYVIEGGTLLKRVGEVVAMPEYKDLKHGVKIIKYILWTLNNHYILTGDISAKGAAYWFYDKSYFLAKVDRFENKHLEEGLKVISVIPTYSFEIHFDAKLVVNTLHQTLKEFKANEGDYAEITALKEKGPSFQKIFEDLKDSLIHFYVYNIIQRDKNYKQHLMEILKDPVISHKFDKEAKEIIGSAGSRPVHVFEKIKARMDENYAKILTALQMAISYMRIHPEQAFQALRRIYTITLNLPVRKILKYVIKTMTTHVIRSIPSKFTPAVLRALFFMFQETTHRFNTYTNITSINKMKQSSFDLLDVNSELFSRIKFKDLFSMNNSHPEIRENIQNKFITCKERDEMQIREVRSLFSIKHFTRVFSSIHKDIMIFMHNHLSVFLANHIQPLELLNFLQGNFEIINTSIEFLKSSNVFATVTTNLAALNILKNHPLTAIQRRYLQKFYYNTLKFALAFFSKNSQYYVDDTLDSDSCVSKIEKQIELGLKACRYLKVETFMETAQTAERVDIPTKFPPVFIDLNIITPSRTKYIFKFHDSRSRWFYRSLNSKFVGSFGLSRAKKNLSVIYDPSNEKKQVLASANGLSKFQNLRKLVLVLIGHEIDAIKAFNKTELGHLRYEFTLEDKVLNENEARSMLYYAMDLNAQLPIFLLRRLGFALPVVLTGAPGYIRDLVTKYYLFNFQYHVLFDYFVERNLLFPNILKNIFYWDTPQFPLLMKYMTLEYEGQKVLQIYFTKTMKRLESTQLLFYLPQIYQTLNTQASYVVAQTLKEYSQSSYLFSHQLIWKAKVETKREKGETTNTKIPYISHQLLYQLLKGLNSTERFLFKQVDDFFEAITAISGILHPKWPKKKKEEIVAAELKKIHVSEYLYVPCNPQYMIAKIKLDSGRAMQSAAKCPILVSFYCKRFDGPDKHYAKLLNRGKEEEELIEDDDLVADNDEQPSINDLKVSSRIKLLPKESLTNFETANGVPGSKPLEKISEKDEDQTPAATRLMMKGIDGEKETPIPQSILRPEVLPSKDVRFDFEKPDNSGDESKELQMKDEHDISKNGMKLELSMGTMNYIAANESQREEFAMPNERFKTSKFTLHPNNFDQKDGEGALSLPDGKDKIEEKDEEEHYEIISCIFKVFDDIRQDDLALQVISLFKYIFQSVGLDLFLYPYRTISNRTGKDLDIGGLIEVVPNTKSRDQMGKEMNCNLYEYFIARFGNEMSPEFQLARENFIKSMASYSIVSYILQIKDRHNGNILIDPYGHIVHIDFGFIFDISPAHNMKFESANFKLTKEMIQIMGGSQMTEPFNFFADQTTKAFLAIRRFEEQIFNMIKLMTYSGLKCFRPMSLQNLKERFMPRMNELQASLMMRKIILDAYDKLTTNLYDDIQAFQNKIHR